MPRKFQKKDKKMKEDFTSTHKKLKSLLNRMEKYLFNFDDAIKEDLEERKNEDIRQYSSNTNINTT